MTTKRATMTGVRVELPDGRIIDILPSEIDAQSTTDDLFLDPEDLRDAMDELGRIEEVDSEA